MLEEYKVKTLSFSLVIASMFAFGTMASAEVLRSHSKEKTTDQTVVPDVLTPVSATTPKLTGREKRAEAAAAAAAAVEPAPAVVVANIPVANVSTTKLTGREKRAEAAAAAAAVAESAPPVVVAPTVVANVTTTTLTGRERRAEAAAAAAALADTPPLFLPTTTTPVTSEVSTLTASGSTTGRHFKKDQAPVTTPTTNLSTTQFAQVPEPASTSLALIGLFGVAVLLVRRRQARQTVTAE
jgi:hypothetical protein